MKRILKYLPQIVAMLFLAGFAAFAAWQEPPAGTIPPDNNAPAPINVGGNSQIFTDSKTLRVKSDGSGVINLEGGMGVGGFFRAFYTAVFDGNVNIAGQIKITGGSPGAGKVLASDAAGLGSWQINSYGKVACKSDGFGKQCFPLINKIGNSIYYIDGNAVKTMQDGIIGCTAGYVLTYTHPKGVNYHLNGVCGGQAYTNNNQYWHNYCINDINDSNLNSQSCNLTSDPSCVNEGNCWYGRDPIYGPAIQAVCAQINSGGKTAGSIKDGRQDGACQVWSGAFSSFYDATNILIPYSCCTIE